MEPALHLPVAQFKATQRESEAILGRHVETCAGMTLIAIKAPIALDVAGARTLAVHAGGGRFS